MIIYNVTVNIEDASHDDWLEWMKTTHIPDVMKSGLFFACRILKLHTRHEEETGTTYAIQYACRSMEEYERYQRDFAPALQAETRRLYEGKFVAFRTVMEEVFEYASDPPHAAHGESGEV